MKHFMLPKERVGVAVGPRGSVKRYIELKTETKLTFNSETGEVTIEPTKGSPLGPLRAREILNAIARGFSPQRAFLLLDEDMYFEVLDISDFVGDSEKAMVRFKGRIIGKAGKTRRIIEETIGVYMSVYGKTIAFIGTYDQLAIAREAAKMLLRGLPHSAVYRFLEGKRRELKMRAVKLWE